MIRYIDFMGWTQYFPTWKDAIAFAKIRLMTLLELEKYMSKAYSEELLDAYKDLCGIALNTEEQDQALFCIGGIVAYFPLDRREPIGDRVSIYKIESIKVTDNVNRVFKYIYDKRNDLYPYASPKEIKEELQIEKFGAVSGSLLGLFQRNILCKQLVKLPNGKYGGVFYCYNEGVHFR